MRAGINRFGLIVALTHLGVAMVTAENLPEWNGVATEGWEARALVARDDGQAAEGERLDLGPAAADEATNAGASTEILPEKFWTDYYASRPGSFLVDPQRILSGPVARERLAFLNYHAADSAIDLYAYLFKAGQEIPGEVREEELVERAFNDGRPAAIVCFHWGAPKLTRLYLSAELTEVVPLAERRRALASCVDQAAAKSDPSAQFEALLVQMSIRLFWMERLMKAKESGEATVARRVPKVAPPDKKNKLLKVLEPWLDSANCMVPSLQLAGLILFTSSLVLIFRRCRARYRFAVRDVEPRLGADHGAGIGAVISFASPKLSPGQQREP